MIRLIGIVPLGIGLTVLTFAWSSAFDGGMGVPLFFRFSISFIALFFILIGGSLVFAGFQRGFPAGLVDPLLDLQQQLQKGLRRRGLTPTSTGERSLTNVFNRAMSRR